MGYIAYAEDDLDDQLLFREMIADTQPGVPVRTFSTGLELFEYLQHLDVEGQAPTLVVLDINMPVWDGLHTLQAIRRQETLNRIPVVLYTTSRLTKDLQDAAASCGADLITKPCGREETQQVAEKFFQYYAGSS